MSYINIKDMVADSFTKALAKSDFILQRERLGLKASNDKISKAIDKQKEVLRNGNHYQ